MEQENGFLMDEPSWAQRVKQYRLRTNLTQVKLAERLGMSPENIARWETREHRPWSPESQRFLELEEELEAEEAS